MSTTDKLDISEEILRLGKWLRALHHLAANDDFTGWRHEAEPGGLIHLIANARAFAEDLRFVYEPERSRRLRLLLNGLPQARLEQLTSLLDTDTGDGEIRPTEAA